MQWFKCNLFHSFFFQPGPDSTHMMAGTSATVYKAASRLMKISSCVFFWWLFVGSTRRQKAPKAAQSTTIHLATTITCINPLLASHVSGIAASVSQSTWLFLLNILVASTQKIKVPTKIYFNLSSQQKRRSTLQTHGEVVLVVSAKNSEFHHKTAADQQPRPSNEAMAKIEIFQKRAETSRLQPPAAIPAMNIFVEFCRWKSLVGAVRINTPYYMGVSLNGGTPKTRQNDHY